MWIEDGACVMRDGRDVELVVGKENWIEERGGGKWS